MGSHADRKPVTQFKFPRLQLVWSPASAAQAKWHLQLAGLAFREMPRRLNIYLSVRGILLWGAGMLLAAYFVGSAGLAYAWGRNPYNRISYADLVLPSHWGELKAKRGQGLIDEGIHDIRAGKGSSGVMLLNHGLSLKPSDLHGRMVLAQVFLSIGYLHRGRQLLEDGLVFGPPPKQYREALFRLTAYLEDFEQLLAMADQIEKTLPPGDKAAARWLLAQRVTALERLQRFDEIERLRNAQGDSPSFALEAAWARGQLARGNPAEALREIARNPGRFGVPADRCQLQLTLAIAARDPAAAHEAVQAWLKEEPTQPEPRIQEIIALIQLGEANNARDRLQSFFLHFGSEKPAVILLLKNISGLSDIAWLRVANRDAAEAGALSIESHILYMQGLLMAGQVAEATTEFNLTTALIEQAKVKDGGWSEGTRLLLNVINSDSPTDRAQFLGFFRSHRLTPEAFRFALKSLRHTGSTEMVGELSILARNRFPALQDAALMSEQETVAVKHADKPPTVAFRSEAEARFELRRIDEALQVADAPSAFSRLKVIESAGFPAMKAELLTRRIQVHGMMRDQAELSGALQLYLSSPNVSQAWLNQIAQQWAGEQRRDSALTVARETYAKFPQARWAMEMLNLSAPNTTLTAEAVPVTIRTEAEARVGLRRIDEALKAGQYRAALDRIKAIERAKIAPLQAELLLRRIQVHGSLREQTELTAALGYYLSGKTADQTALRNLATQWDNEQLRDSALSLLRATLAKFPQARWAWELRKKIEGDLLVAPGENLLEPKKR